MSAACSPDVYDVLVLGAGAAGLRAGALLAASGRRVAMIEARDRIGGRIFTRHEADAGPRITLPVELGAEFIHGLPEETWHLVRESGLDTDELNGSHLRFAENRLQSAQDQRGVASLLNDMTRWMAARPGADPTFAQYLEQAGIDAPGRNAAIQYVEGFNAADHRVIGVAALVRQQAAEDRIEADRLFHVRAGYDRLPRYLLHTFEAAGGTLCVEKPVKTIQWRAGAVTMTGMDSRGNAFELRGRQAVITLPLGVLQAQTVRFDPAPATTLLNAGRMAMGSVVRIPMIFRSRFWRDHASLARFPTLAGELERLSFLFSGLAIPTWWTPYPNETPMIVAWAAGPSSLRLERARRADGARPAVVDQCLALLAQVFRTTVPELEAQLASWHFHDWDADEYARGAYSYMPAGSLLASDEMAEPVANTLYFAGEHTTTSGHWGTVHGALQSGAAAAAKIMATID